MRLISTVGWNPKIVLFPMQVLRPEENYIIYGTVPEERKKTESVISEIRANWDYGDLHFVEVDPFDLRDMVEKIKEIGITDDTVVNITGGTKIMSFALTISAAVRPGGEVPIIYVTTDKSGEGDSMRIKRIPLGIREISRVSKNNSRGGKKLTTAELILKILAENGGTMGGPDIRKKMEEEYGHIVKQGTFSDVKKILECLNLIHVGRNGRELQLTLFPGAWFFIENCKEVCQ